MTDSTLIQTSHGVERTEEPVYGVTVYVHVQSTGRHGSMTAVPFHEVPLMRRRLELEGESLDVIPEWTSYAPRERTMSRSQLLDERARLDRAYTVQVGENTLQNLVDDLYGPAGGRRLVDLIRDLYTRYQALRDKRGGFNKLTKGDTDELLAMTDPNADLQPLDTIPVPTDLTVNDPDATEVSGDLTTHLSEVGYDQDTAQAIARLVAQFNGVDKIPAAEWKKVEAVGSNMDRRQAAVNAVRDFKPPKE